MVTTTYTCSGYGPGDDSVFNGDFDQGNSGFTSAYVYYDNLYGEGTYYVGADAQDYHPDFHGTAHGGSGNFMIINGSTSPNTNVWTQQISVSPNAYYAFSTWVCTVSAAGNVAELQFAINGNQLGEVFYAPESTYVWRRFYELWYSGNSTTATITILNQNTQGSGNDFGLDDISFCELVLLGAPQCTVSVESLTATAIADDTELCEGSSTTLHAVPTGGLGNYTFNWTPANTLNDASSMDPVATPPIGTTTYTCHVSDGYTDLYVDVTILVHPNKEIDIFHTICENDTYQFFDDDLQTPGLYEQTLQTQYGCDSTIHLHLDNWPTYDINTEDYICEGDTYPFYGQQLGTAGVYTHVLQSEHGCDSTIILNLGIWPTYETHVTADISEGDTCLFYGQQLSAPGVYTHTLQSNHGCDSTIVLNLGVWPTYAIVVTENICEGETYSFFGQQLDTTGVYTQTYQSEHGFDSTYVLHLDVWPTYVTNVEATICEGDTYSFFGQQLSTPNVYTQVLQSGHGCDSTIILNLGVWPTYETTIDESICEGDAYLFFGQQLTTEGVHTQVLQSGHGCDSTIILNLGVWPKYETNISANICEDDTYSFFDQQLSTPDVYTHTLQSVHGCDSTIVLNLGMWPVYETNLADEICEGDAYPFFGQQLNAPDVYTHTLQSVHGCDSTIILNLDMWPVYETEIAADICEGDTYLFFGQELDIAGVHTHTLQSLHGCDSVIRLNLGLNPTNQHEFTVSEEDSCDEYFWDPKGHVIISTDHEGSYYTTTGVYHRTYLNQTGCDSIVTMNVQFEYTPDPTAIMPADSDNTAPHWVVTATEFQINTYEYHLWDNNPLCQWDTVTWSIEGPVQWVLEPYGDKAKYCKVFVLDQTNDTVWLKAHAINRCASNPGVERKYWLLCSFYGTEERPDSHSDFTVLPNPNNGQMELRFEHITGKIDVKVYDMKGNMVDGFQTYNDMEFNTLPYHLDRCAGGIYFFVVTGKEGTVSKKVVVK